MDKLKNQNQKLCNKSPSQSIFYFIALIILIAYVIQDIFTRNLLFDLSIDQIEQFQNKNDQSALDFNKFISDSTFVVISLLIAYVYYQCPNKIDALIFISINVFTIYFHHLLKLCYHDPRPYMESMKLNGEECILEYGNPSGHSMISITTLGLGPWFLDHNFYNFYENGKIQIKRIIAGFIIYLYLALIGLSRNYLGVHSLNQILLGFCIGILIMITIIYFLYQYIYDFCILCIQIAKLSNSQQEEDQQTNYQKRRLHLLIIIIIIYILLNGLNILVYELVKYDAEENQQSKIIIWNLRIEHACKQTIESKYSDYLYNKSFIESGVFSFILGIIMGFLISKGEFNPSISSEKYAQLPILKKIYRLIIILLIVAVVAVPFVFGMPEAGEREIYLKYFLQYNLPLLAVGILITNIFPQILHKLNLDVEGDLLQQVDK